MIIVLLGNGFEDIEALAPCDVLRRAGYEVKLAGIGGTEILSGRGVPVRADCTVEDIVGIVPELLIIPGGNGGVDSIWNDSTAISVITAAYEANAPIGAICAGPVILSRLGYLRDKHAVCHPSRAAELVCARLMPQMSTVTDGRIVTARAAASSIDFGFALLKLLSGSDAAETVAEGMCYHGTV